MEQFDALLALDDEFEAMRREYDQIIAGTKALRDGDVARAQQCVEEWRRLAMPRLDADVMKQKEAEWEAQWRQQLAMTARPAGVRRPTTCSRRPRGHQPRRAPRRTATARGGSGGDDGPGDGPSDPPAAVLRGLRLVEQEAARRPLSFRDVHRIANSVGLTTGPERAEFFYALPDETRRAAWACLATEAQGVAA